MIDVIGMGVSSRINDYDKNRFTPEDSTQYFVEKFERWRVEVGKHLVTGELKDFFLAGHSFGGWMVGNYMAKYHENVKKAMLLSPIGLRSFEDYDHQWRSKVHPDYGAGAPPSVGCC